MVPTWNYLTAQVYGRLVVHDDVDWLRSLVTRLTERHEAADQADALGGDRRARAVHRRPVARDRRASSW